MTRINSITGEILDDDAPAGQAGTEIVTGQLLPAQRDTGTIDISQYASLDDLVASYVEEEPDPRQVFAWIVGAQEKDDEEPEDSQLSIMLRILQADKPELILASQEVTKADQILNEPLDVRTVKWKKSTKGDGPGVYALITGTKVSTGDDLVISCGAKQVMVQLLRLQSLKLLPVRVIVRQKIQPTANGNHPLWLEPSA